MNIFSKSNQKDTYIDDNGDILVDKKFIATISTLPTTELDLVDTS